VQSVTDRLWAEILHKVRRDNPDIFAPWFGQLRPFTLEHGLLRVAGPDAPRTEWLHRNAASAFTAAAQAVTGYLLAVEFVPGDFESAPLREFPESWFASPRNLAPEYIFGNFVVGPTNRFAHAACLAVSENPGKSYNPLFLHGNVGLGKTHLLQAVCREMLTRTPETRVLYLSCEAFVNDFIDAIEKNQLPAFRQLLRGADCLVVDDVQFLTAGERTQEEFFHTFNTLYQSARQIILSADCSPENIGGLEERLVSRFKWGLVAQVDPPDFETRVAILRKKARLRNAEVPDDVIRLVAEAVAGNTRELEGALTTLQHAARFENRLIDADLARAALRGLLPRDPAPRELTLQHIIDAACRHFGLRPTDLSGKRRTRVIALARQISMYVARQLTRLSLEEIGGYFGGRDHSTVLYAEQTIDTERQTDPEVRAAVDRIMTELGAGT
jgi:chromosomal replication initiator protein